MTGSYPVGFGRCNTGTEQVEDPQKYFTVEKWSSMKCRKWEVDSLNGYGILN